MTPAELIAAIVCISLATFATRAGVLMLGDRLTLSPRVDAALRFAPVCALTALVVPAVLYTSSAIDASASNPRLPAALAAAAFVLWRSSMTGCIVVGMAVYYLFRFW